jgi:hypothetical protein
MIMIIDFDSSASFAKAFLLSIVIRIKFGKARATKFLNGYKMGISYKNLKNSLTNIGFSRITSLNKGVNYLVCGKKIL